MIAREDEHIVRILIIDKIDVLRDRIRRSAVFRKGRILFLARREHIHAAVIGIQSPALSGCRIRVEQHALILRQDADHIDAGVGAVAQGKIDDAVLPAEIHGRLGNLLRQLIQACSASACEDHCDHLVLLHVDHPSF